MGAVDWLSVAAIGVDDCPLSVDDDIFFVLNIIFCVIYLLQTFSLPIANTLKEIKGILYNCEMGFRKRCNLNKF